MNVNCFLGANSAGGFFSLYGGFCSGEGDFLHLIKAGPGGGKSGFMRRVAQAAADHGYDTECVLCSGPLCTSGSWMQQRRTHASLQILRTIQIMLT